ncbi:MAG: hypothetical protein LUQ07_03130 [Methanospirillum sp.]|nr:hypothetical protein [Methanospirillum sp.]
MNRYLIITGILLLSLSASGVSAFSISVVNYTLGTDGNGSVEMEYHLNDTEKAQYDLITSVIDLKAIGKKELEKAFNREVAVSSLSPESLTLQVIGMATVNGSEMTTPSFTYVPVESLVEPDLLWIVKKFDIGFIPESSTITFPDGYTQSFTDVKTIPGIVHTLGE